MSIIIWTWVFIFLSSSSELCTETKTDCLVPLELANNISFGNLEVNESYTLVNNDWLKPVTVIEPSDLKLTYAHHPQAPENNILTITLFKGGKFSRVLLGRQYRCRKRVKFTYIIILVAIILLSGDVESNPGPTQVNI